MRKFLSYIPTLGPIGYLPAPGTCATLVTLPLMICARMYTTHMQYFGLCAVLFFLSILIIQKTHQFFGHQKDPSCIVIDELVGCMVTFLYVPLALSSLLFGFILFRLLDIFKLSLIRKCEELPGAWGIMTDDLVAAICANVILQLLLPFLI